MKDRNRDSIVFLVLYAFFFLILGLVLGGHMMIWWFPLIRHTLLTVFGILTIPLAVLTMLFLKKLTSKDRQ